MFYFPERSAMVGMVLYLLLLLAAPLDVVFPLTTKAPIYILTCYAMFWTGCAVAALRDIGTKSTVRPALSKWNFWLCSFLGFAGMLSRIYDKYFIRGVDLAASAIEARDALESAGAGPLAALAGILYPFCYVPLIIIWSTKTSEKRSILYPACAFSLFLAPSIDALLILSRSQMLVAFTMMFVAASCTLFSGAILKTRLILPVIAGATLVLLSTIIVFGSRLGEMDLDLITSILTSAYGYVLTPNQAALKSIESNSLTGSVLSSTIPIIQYYLHGLFEFDLHLNKIGEQQFAYGLNTFAPYVKALNIFGLIDTSNIDFDDYYYRVGVFTTFFGPLWVDFGWAGTYFMFIFGYISKIIAQDAKLGKLGAIPLHCYLTVVLLYLPVVNFMVSATGMYVITAFTLFYAFAPNKHQETQTNPP